MANVRSLRNKLDELEAICNVQKVDVVCLTETWSSGLDRDVDLTVPGFTVINRLDKDTGSGIGGGNIVLAREGVKVIGCPSQLNGNGAYAQITTSEIICKKGLRVKLMNAYRSPAKDTEEPSIGTIEEIFKSACANTIIIGDINVPEIDFKMFNI